MEDEGLHRGQKLTMYDYNGDEYECSECGDEFETERGMKRHIHQIHPDEWMLLPVKLGMDPGGYERWRHRYDGQMDNLSHHQLIACLDHDPHEVFAPDTNVHHGPIEHPLANWAGNLEVMTNIDHGRHHQKGIPRQDLLDELTRLADELDKTPTARDMENDGKFDTDTYQNRFGSWNDAILAAGLEPNRGYAGPMNGEPERGNVLQDWS